MQNQTVEYIPFGDQWRKKMTKHSVSSLCENFNVVKLKGERKKDIIDKIRIKLVINSFNEEYKIGSSLLWRPSIDERPIVVTVKKKAYDSYGVAVAFFEERSGFCCIEPQFIV